MIYIVEDKNKYLSGLTSLFIYTEYNKDVYKVISSCDTYKHIEKPESFEVPITSLSFLLDNLYYYDDVQLIVKDEEEPKVEDVEQVVQYKSHPFNYQNDAIKYGLAHKKWLLLDEPGLGKSLSAICLAEELKAQKGIEHCLVICGLASLRLNWQLEINKHSNLTSRVIGSRITRTGNLVWESNKKKAEELMSPIDEFFCIINIESLRDGEIIDAINNGPNKFGFIIFDECHKAKGWSSQQAKGLLDLKAEYQVGMTGTLLVNNPLDAYQALAWIDVEKPKGVTRFKSTYCIQDEKTYQVLGFKNLELFKNEVDSCSLRRTKDLLDLPEKNFIDEYLTMDDDHKKFYDAVENALLGREQRKDAKKVCDKIELSARNFEELMVRLRQATTCPQLLTSLKMSNCKLERAKELVEQITSNNDKVVIMSSFKEPVREMTNMLKDYSPLVCTGDNSDDEVFNNIKMFQEDDKHKVMICTIAKMGTGVTLTRASYMIFLDLPWEPATYEQACDRIHRIGAKKPVFIYNLMCSKTVDVATHYAIISKKALSDYIIDDKDSNFIQRIIDKMTTVV